MWLQILLAIWGCIPELSSNCKDMTNASSAYFGIVGGAAIGAVVSWWIYYRQKKITEKQDFILNRIKEVDENHEQLLKKLQVVEQHHDDTLNTILELSKKIDHIVEKQDRLQELMNKSDSNK